MSDEETLWEWILLLEHVSEFQDDSDLTETSNKRVRERENASFDSFALPLLLVPYNLITSTVRSLREDLKPPPTLLTLLPLSQYGKGSVWDFPVTT